MTKAEISSDTEKNYELPHREVITIGHERFGCPQVLFKPSLIGKESQAIIYKLAYDSIIKHDSDIRSELNTKTVCYLVVQCSCSRCTVRLIVSNKN